MRRVVGVFAAVTLVVGASGLGLVGNAGAGLPPPNPILKVKKVVTGTSTTGFTVGVKCVIPVGAPSLPEAQTPLDPDATLTFNADGTPNTSSTTNWQSVAGNWQFQNSNLGAAVCTVTETPPAGVASVSYACAFKLGVPSGGDGVEPAGCLASGPSSAPAVVTYAGICGRADLTCAQGSEALVTVTNAYPVAAAAAVETVINFTG
jgi:hypothetical protein